MSSVSFLDLSYTSMVTGGCFCPAHCFLANRLMRHHSRKVRETKNAPILFEYGHDSESHSNFDGKAWLQQ